jgi:hypothetical protein
MEKLKIELTPYAAVCIYKFISEFEPEMEKEPLLVSFKECYEEYSNELFLKITKEQLEDAVMQTSINQVLLRDPPSKDF